MWAISETLCKLDSYFLGEHVKVILHVEENSEDR